MNINGFLNVIHASKENNVRGFIYAASSSTYGDHEALPKVENKIGNQLSQYAITKYVNELYAEIGNVSTIDDESGYSATTVVGGITELPWSPYAK